MTGLPAEQNFLGLEAEHSHYETSRVVVLQAPYEHTSSYLQGSADGPAAIVEASQQVEFYDDETGRETAQAVGIATVAPLTFGEDEIDARAVDKIRAAVASHLAADKFVVTIGAEHTISLGTVEAHLSRHPTLTVLQFDAHSDLREAYEGNPHSHASVMARVAEHGVGLVQIGIRAQAREEAERIAADPKITTIYAHQMYLAPYRGGDGWMDAALAALGDEVYISFDCDYFDPSICPAVGTPVPGGPGWYETLRFLRRVFRERTVVGLDLVELAPQPGDIRSPFVAAQILYKMLTYRFLEEKTT